MAEATQQETEQPDTEHQHTEEQHSSTNAREAETTQPALSGMLLRDAALLLAALSLWAAADTWYAVSGLALAQVIGVADGILVGLLIAALFHEWGHYAGAVASKAESCRVNPVGLSLFRFKFDYETNDHRQFHWMTYGGHIAHWTVTLALFLALPMDSLGRISLVGGMVGFVAFASFFEYHILKDTWQGDSPGSRLAAVTPADFQQAGLVGLLAGLFFIAALA